MNMSQSEMHFATLALCSQEDIVEDKYSTQAGSAGQANDVAKNPIFGNFGNYIQFPKSS